MGLEATLVFHDFTTRPAEEARIWYLFRCIGSPGHDPTKLIMIPILERLGLSWKTKAIATLVLTYTTRRQTELYDYLILFPPFGARVTLYHISIPTDTGIGGTSALCLSASGSPNCLCDEHEYVPRVF
jgi:hypothetical protein